VRLDHRLAPHQHDAVIVIVRPCKTVETPCWGLNHRVVTPEISVK